MILKQIFKTLYGAQRRAAFETAHSPFHSYTVRRFHADGAQAVGTPLTKGDYYRLEKVRKEAPCKTRPKDTSR